MNIKKTIKAGVVHLTNIKNELLNREYDALQAYLRGDSNVVLYSANKQQAKRLYKKIKPEKEYPLSIRKDLIRVEKKDTKIAKYWARIPVAGRRGGVWVAIKPHEDIHEDVEICESKLIRRDGEFFLHITIEKEIHFERKEKKGFLFYAPSGLILSEKTAIIGVDIGEAVPIASVVRFGSEKEARFYGREVRGIRAHYNHLRKSIGRKKVKHGIKVIKRIGDAERRKVRDILHKATRMIVNEAKDLRERGFEPVIVVGDLKGHRKPRIKGKPRCRKKNRKIHTMPSYQIKEMLRYKSLWEGIPIAFVNESYTSARCHRCKSDGIRKKGLFMCPNCGLEYNSHLNAANNICDRFLGYMLGNRASVNMPQTPTAFSVPEKGTSGEAMCDGGSHLRW